MFLHVLPDLLVNHARFFIRKGVGGARKDRREGGGGGGNTHRTALSTLLIFDPMVV